MSLFDFSPKDNRADETLWAAGTIVNSSPVFILATVEQMMAHPLSMSNIVLVFYFSKTKEEKHFKYCLIAQFKLCFSSELLCLLLVTFEM